MIISYNAVEFNFLFLTIHPFLSDLMKLFSSPFLLASSILLLGPNVFVAASKKKMKPSPKSDKQPKHPKQPKPSKKQGQCLKSDYLEASAAVVRRELSGDYFIC